MVINFHRGGSLLKLREFVRNPQKSFELLSNKHPDGISDKVESNRLVCFCALFEARSHNELNKTCFAFQGVRFPT